MSSCDRYQYHKKKIKTKTKSDEQDDEKLNRGKIKAIICEIDTDKKRQRYIKT